MDFQLRIICIKYGGELEIRTLGSICQKNKYVHSLLEIQCQLELTIQFNDSPYSKISNIFSDLHWTRSIRTSCGMFKFQIISTFKLNHSINFSFLQVDLAKQNLKDSDVVSEFFPVFLIHAGFFHCARNDRLVQKTERWGMNQKNYFFDI